MTDDIQITPNKHPLAEIYDTIRYILNDLTENDKILLAVNLSHSTEL